MSEELFQASREGREDDVRRLIERGVDVNAAVDDVHGETALHIASFYGHVNIVNILLAAGDANIHAVSKDGFTALHRASQEGHKDVVNLLLTAGVDVNAVTVNGNTALHHASRYGHKDVVNLLLTRGANIHAVSKFGYTALHNASRYGNVDIVRLLLTAGVDVHAVNVDRQTALGRARSEGHQDVVNVLLAHLYKVNVQSQKKAIVQQTAGATAANTAGVTTAVTAGATSAVTAAVTAGATAAVTTGATSAVTAGATAGVTTGTTAAVTAGATAAVTAGATAVTAGAKANLKEEKSKSVKVSNKNEDIVQELQAVKIGVKDKIKHFDKLEDVKNKEVATLNRGRLPKADFRTLREFHVRLKTDLRPFPLIDHLFQRGVIDDDELDVIKKAMDKGRAEGVEKILQILHFSGRDAFRLFLECLEQEKVGYKDLAEELKHHRYTRVQADINTLRHFHDFFKDDLVLYPLIDYLFQRRIIDENQLDVITRTREQRGRDASIEKMLEILKDCGNHAFQLFLECLEQEKVGYKDLADELKHHRYTRVQPDNNTTTLNRGRLPEADFRTLQEFHVRLKTDLVPDPLIDHLFQKGVINDDELDVIKKVLEKGRAASVGKMLQILRFSGRDAFRLFLECLEQEDVGYKDLANELKHHRYTSVIGDINTLKHFHDRLKHYNDTRVQADINTRQHFHYRLKDDLVPVPLIDHLFMKGVINLDEMDTIEKRLERGRAEGVEKMLKILRFSRADDFDLFLECLENVRYKDLASELRKHRYGEAQP